MRLTPFTRKFIIFFLNFRFFVQSKLALPYWPKDSVVTYVDDGKVDTHNAMNTGTGTFTAPFSGIYGFTFTALFDCGYDDRRMYFKHNGKRDGAPIHICRLFLTDSTTDYILGSDTVSFSRYMQKGDRLQIDSGGARIYVRFDVKFRIIRF